MTRIDLIIHDKREFSLVHDAHHLWTCFRMHWKREMSRGFSGGKQVLKFADRSNRGQVLLSFHQFFKRVQRWRVSWIGSTILWNPVNKVTNGPKKFGRINEAFFFYKKMSGRFARRPKKVAVLTDEVAVRRGFTVLKWTLWYSCSRFPHGPITLKRNGVVWNYTLLRLIWRSACLSYVHFWTQVTQGRPVSNADVVVPFVNGSLPFLWHFL